MTTSIDDAQGGGARLTLRFTPAEWRALLGDPAFLRDADNSYCPRRLMGLPVQIVPDHRTVVDISRPSPVRAAAAPPAGRSWLGRLTDCGVRSFTVTLAAAALGGTPALAQATDEGPIATASASAPAPTATGAAAPLPTTPSDAAPEPDAPSPARDGKVHGMIEAGVGTGGYREGAAEIDAPLPGGGEADVAVSGVQGQTVRGRR